MSRTWVVLVGLLSLMSACVLSETRVKRERASASYYGLGVAHLNENQIQQAYIEFQKAVEADPKNKDAHYALGHVHFQKENYTDAIAAFRKALALDPGYSDAHNYLGKVHESQGRMDDAIAEYQMALSNPQYETPQKPHLNLGLIYLRQNRHQEAAAAFGKALRIDPGNYMARSGLGRAYLSVGKIKEAIAEYEEAARLAPEDPDVHYDLGEAYLKGEAHALAAAAIEKAVALSPQDPRASDARARLDALRGTQGRRSP